MKATMNKKEDSFINLISFLILPLSNFYANDFHIQRKSVMSFLKAIILHKLQKEL